MSALPNENGVYQPQLTEELARRDRSYARVKICQCEDGLYRFALDMAYSYGGFCSLITASTEGYSSPNEAKEAAAQRLLRRFPKAWASEPRSVHDELHARCLDVGRVVRVSGQRRDHLRRRLAHGRIGGEGGAGRRGLDQHVLCRRVELRRRVLMQHPLGLPGLARAVCRQVPRAERLARHEDRGDQEQPAENGGLAVRGAPAGHPLGTP